MAHKGPITQLSVSLAKAKAKFHLPLPVLYLIWKKLTHSLKWEENLTLRSQWDFYFFSFPETTVVPHFLLWIANPFALIDVLVWSPSQAHSQGDWVLLWMCAVHVITCRALWWTSQHFSPHQLSLAHQPTKALYNPGFCTDSHCCNGLKSKSKL